MKKGIVVLFVLLLAGSLCAQSMGLKGGLNFANLTGDDSGDPDSKLGFAFGGFYTHPMTETFFIQPELLFTMKGAKDEFTYSGSTYDVSYNLNYIELPILAKMCFPMDSFTPNLFLGPALAFNMSATVEVDDESDDIEDVKAMDFGLIFGGGADFGKFTVDARFNMGLTNIFDVEGDPKVKNSVMSILLGYKLK
jgi:hypothetical protein